MEDIPLCYLLHKVHLLLRTQHRFILITPYVHATCFSHFSGYHQACQYKKLSKRRYNEIICKGHLVYNHSFLIILKYRTQNYIKYKVRHPNKP